MHGIARCGMRGSLRSADRDIRLNVTIQRGSSRWVNGKGLGYGISRLKTRRSSDSGIKSEEGYGQRRLGRRWSIGCKTQWRRGLSTLPDKNENADTPKKYVVPFHTTWAGIVQSHRLTKSSRSQDLPSPLSSTKTSTLSPIS